MPDPTYTLAQFNYQPAYLQATITQVVDGKTWSLRVVINGEAATTIWAARGETEEQLIARILAA